MFLRLRFKKNLKSSGEGSMLTIGYVETMNVGGGDDKTADDRHLIDISNVCLVAPPPTKRVRFYSKDG